MKTLKLMIFTFCMFGFILSVPAMAQETAATTTDTGMPDEAMMEKMMEMGSPGEQHDILDPLAGEWEYTVTYKMGPDEPEQTSTGTSENRWVLGGRFMQQRISGTMKMGDETHNFEGIGFIGYNKIENEYSTTWLDNMNTGMMTASGEYDPATKTIMESGNYSCSMRGEEIAFTSELQFVDNNNVTYTMYETAPDGEQYKSMVINYKRSSQRPS